MPRAFGGARVSRALGGARVSLSRFLAGRARVSHFTRFRGARVSHFTGLREGDARVSHFTPGLGGPGFHISRAFGGDARVSHFTPGLGGPGFHISRAFRGPGFHISSAFGGPGFHISRRAFGGRQGFTNHWPSHGLGAPGSHFCWVSEGAKLFRISRAFGGGTGVTGVTVSRSRRHRNHDNQGSHGVTLVSFQIVEKAFSPKGRTTFFGRHDPQTNSCRGLTAGRSVTFR